MKFSFQSISSWLLVAILLVISIIITCDVDAFEIRAGLEQNPPLSFIDENGEPSGLLVEILNHVAAQSGWQVKYIPDTFDRCLQKLTSGDIDLMVTIAFSNERAKYYDFNEENIVANWGIVYSSGDHNLQSYLDLSGLKIAVMKNDIHHKAFRSLLEKFNISPEFFEVDDFGAVFDSLDSGEADAGVVGRFFALKNENKRAVKSTPLIFNPVEIRYATAKGTNSNVLNALDYNLKRLKKDPSSFYYQALDRWLGISSNNHRPPWFWPALYTLVASLAVSLISMILLRGKLVGSAKKLNIEVAKRNFAQRELALVEQSYRTIVEHANAIILCFDEDGVITFINRFGQDLFGYSEGELVGQNVIGTIVPNMAMDGKDLVRMIHEICDDPDKFHANENENITKSGGRIWISWRNQPVYDQYGVKKGVLSVGQDITAKRNEEKVREEYDKAKDFFISTAAHELNTPLTAMVGFLELLAKEPGFESFQDEQKQSFLDIALNKSYALCKIVGDLLDLSRIQQGKNIPINKSDQSLVSFAKSLIRQYETIHDAHTFNLRISNNLNHRISFDVDRMTQVFDNLISNAVKYSPRGNKVSIDMAMLDTEVHVTISDQGVGMSQEQVDKIFDHFYRADNSDTAIGGLGLGMGIARSIVEEHNGRIWVESTLRVGTDVHFTLPSALLDQGPQ